MKRSLSILAGLLLTAAPLSLTAQAASVSAPTAVGVHVMIEGANGLDIEKTVDVTPMTYATTSGQREVMSQPTALGALLRALYAQGDARVSIRSTSYGIYVAGVAGQDEKMIDSNTGWSDWVNGVLPPVGADQTTIHSGDTVVWALNDWEQTLYPDVQLSATTVPVGGSLGVTVTSNETTYAADGSAKTTTVPVADAVVHAGSFTARTDANGHASLTLSTHGTFPVWVNKVAPSGLPLVIHSVPQTVVVGPDEANVTVRVEGYKGSTSTTNLTVTGTDVVTADGQDLKQSGPTALAALAEVAKMKGWTIAVRDTAYGPYVSSFDGQSEKDINANTGWNAVVDGAAAATSLDQVNLKDGDTLTFYFGDWTQTAYPTVRVTPTAVARGGSVNVSVTVQGYDAAGNTVTLHPAGVDVHAGTLSVKTGPDGTASVAMNQPGTTSVWVGERGADGLPIVADSTPVQVNVGSAPIAAFHDLPSGEMGSAISDLANRGILNGEGNGLVLPDQVITRAEFARMLATALQLPSNASSASFRDVSPGAWYATYVQAVNAAGLMLGTSPETFSPNAPLQREDLAILVDRALNLLDDAYTQSALSPSGEQLPYPDGSQASAYAVPWIAAASDQPSFTRAIGSALRPHEGLSRGDAALAIDEMVQSPTTAPSGGSGA